MELRNFWTNKKNEKTLLKIIEWSHRNHILIENVEKHHIKEALNTYLRDSSHSS